MHPLSAADAGQRDRRLPSPPLELWKFLVGLIRVSRSCIVCRSLAGTIAHVLFSLLTSLLVRAMVIWLMVAKLAVSSAVSCNVNELDDASRSLLDILRQYNLGNSLI